MQTSDDAVDRLQRRLRETCDELWNRFVDPSESYLDDDGLPWIPLTTGSAACDASRPAFATEQELALIRAQCRALAVNNEFAINGHENRINYIVGPGHSYRATLKKHGAAPPQLAAEVQTVLDRFLRENHWHRRQQELVRRSDRDGEAFVRFFLAADGSTVLRFIEPDQIRTPPELVDDPAAAFGIRTDRQDVETVQGYYIDGVLVRADEIQHRKSNVDFNVRRGLPLFYPVRKNLRRAERLLRNMSVVAEIQSAIALIRKHRNGTRTAT
ncbi:MAG TPA: phage portal protein, partial [Pirellulales bacterium]|nr:phage portal protein [Pirellulales bacterium]